MAKRAMKLSVTVTYKAVPDYEERLKKVMDVLLQRPGGEVQTPQKGECKNDTT